MLAPTWWRQRRAAKATPRRLGAISIAVSWSVSLEDASSANASARSCISTLCLLLASVLLILIMPTPFYHTEYNPSFIAVVLGMMKALAYSFLYVMLLAVVKLNQFFYRTIISMEGRIRALRWAVDLGLRPMVLTPSHPLRKKAE